MVVAASWPDIVEHLDYNSYLFLFVASRAFLVRVILFDIAHIAAAFDDVSAIAAGTVINVDGYEYFVSLCAPNEHFSFYHLKISIQLLRLFLILFHDDL